MATHPNMRSETRVMTAPDSPEDQHKQETLAELVRSFVPIKIKGEPLSQTIIRLRGEE